MTWQRLIFEFFTYGILIYSFLLLFFYLFIGIYSATEIRKYLRRNSFADLRVLAASTHLPGISILAPAYNEAANIVENVRSMLSIHYNLLELIIINDGSKDDSLQLLIEAYDLYKTNIFVNEQIPTKKIRGIYKSNNPVFNKLIVVDKENGGKADALNVGVNIAKYGYFVCVDVDCVLEQDALLKMIKPFLEETKFRVIASGGVIRIANDCKIENGKLIEINLPKKFLPRVQTIEYIRAFLLGRMAWSRLNGLLLISGAFGAFDKEIVIKCGGYNVKTVGEDMELIVRMRRYMEEHKLPYKVTYIHDPLCWTEAPANYKILGRQRNRWTRGTIETLRIHKIMFFNPRYGLLGMVSYPYWFFFEFLAPIIEFLGFAFFLFFAFFGLIQWASFFALLGCILSFGFLYSVFAILMEVLTYNQYRNKKDVYKLVLTAFIEPFVFHPFVVWSAIKGNIDYIRKRNSWGVMTRQGLNSSQPTVSIAAKAGEKSVIGEDVISADIPLIIEAEPKKHSRIVQGIKESAVYSVILIASMLFIKIFELVRDTQHFGVPKYFSKVIEYGIINDLSFGLNIAIIPVVIFIVLFLLNKKIARFFFITFSLLLIVVHAVLAEYFLETLVPLGADLLGYTMADIKETVGAAGVSITFIFSAVLIMAFVVTSFILIPKKLKLSKSFSFIMLGIFVLAARGSIASITNAWKPGQEFSNEISLNKSYYFYTSCYKTLYGSKIADVPANASSLLAGGTTFNYIDEKHYPFLHTVDSTDVLSPFFNKQDTAPNLVFIVVEGLGRAFSNKDAYLGSFTPFIDSLSGKSLYWSNFLSEGGRTFAMLPSIFGSLPFGKNGFLELGNQMPAHLSLFNILKQNGYSNSFFYGGDASFDNMDKFVKMDGGNVYDEKTFSASYVKMPPSDNGFSWGYGDDQVFKKYIEEDNKMKGPTCNVVMTLSTHSPFIINEEDKYLQLFEQRMVDLGFTEAQKEEHRRYKNQYASILYLDNSVRDFINAYSSRPGFSNTIFVITGDHRMPEIPMSTKIDRYHVPLIIYSKLLKQSKMFEAVSTHFDITPSLLALLKHQYNFKVPTVATWMGEGLDTASEFRNIHSYPLMQTKNDIVDFVMDEYMLHGDDLYKISNHMYLDPFNDDKEKAKLKASFDKFLQKNYSSVTKGASMLPDSLLIK
jgi:cellulose synthase/poly-beta-1,6-N-acetylglucosamine synthase-like glycosyltransferase/phosphoglycerol transferase MdoB-like AlkP superfamily enzyme